MGKIHKDNKNRLITGLIIVVIIIIFYKYYYYHSSHYSQKDYFQNLTIGSKSGFGFEVEDSNYPLFLNMYPKELGSDFKLRSMIQKLKYLDQGPQRLKKLRGIYTNGLGQVNIGSDKIPIIIIPGLGVSEIFAKWDIRSSPNIKTLDAYGNFEMKDKWSCRTVQDEWVPLWFPQETDNLARYCWSSNASIVIGSDGQPTDNEGITTIVPHFGTPVFLNNYMSTLIEALEADGYVKDSTLFAANYDFRKITSESEFKAFKDSFVNLVNGVNGGKGVILLTHDLGSVIGSVLLNELESEWKTKNIKKFISIAGSFGGSPKALRTILSGPSLDTKNKSDNDIFRNTFMNYSGLMLSLPNPNIYTEPMLINQKVPYSPKNIPDLLNQISNSNTSKLYELALNFQNKSLKAPEVPTYILGGLNVQTESNYIYSDSLTDDPERTFPYYDTFKANNNKFNFNNLQRVNTLFNGDGTLPDLSLKYPLNWAKEQTQPVLFKFYNDAEHLKILSMNEPVKDILEIIHDQ